MIAVNFLVGFIGLTVILFALAYALTRLFRRGIGERRWGKLMKFRRSTR